MPVQSLTRFSQAERHALAAPSLAYTPWAARLFVFVGALALTAYGAYEMYRVVRVGVVTLLEWALVVLFVANFSWIALAFTTGVAGFFWLVFRAGAPGELPHSLSKKTAVVMPIYNETPARVFAAIQAICEDVAATGLGSAFDYFFLSDTTDPDIWIAEERALLAIRRRLPEERLYYRHRRKNTHRKAGNIADFVTRWGGAYDHMVVLDADSLMTGNSIVRLAAAMEADPDAGIIQTSPLIINRNTFFARVQQFAARITGPIVSAGMSAWMGRDGNYWGHNAIIRTSAFAAHCGLPDLPGRPPVGGQILSHDFVEGALMRRAGYAVYALPTLGGSYEESPPSLIDLAARDRRWCQGNLQHTRLLATKGLVLASRQHLAAGVMGYLASPLWMAQLLVGIALVLQTSYIRPEYFTADFSLFPAWPRFDAERALRLFELTMGVLLAPEVSRPCRRIDRRPGADGQRRRRSPDRLGGVRDHHVGAAGADHDGDAVRLRHADIVGQRHRVEPAKTRRRINTVRQHRAASSRAYGARRPDVVRRPADLAIPRGLDVADDRRPDSRNPAVLGERSPVAGRRAPPARPAGDAGGERAARHRSALERAFDRTGAHRPRWRRRPARHPWRRGLSRAA